LKLIFVVDALALDQKSIGQLTVDGLFYASW